MEARPFDRAWEVSRTSLRTRLTRLRSKSWAVAQCAIAAGVAWFLAADVFRHDMPFFAPIAAVVCLGTSFGQRLRRVAEVTVGVALGVLIADLLVIAIGTGAWQLTLIVALAMCTAFLLDGGPLLVTQAGVQSIVVATLVPGADGALLRWTDALIGGAVALVAATVVPAAPLRRPRENAAAVTRKISALLRAAADVMDHGNSDPAFALLRDARSTDYLIRELRAAADEGLSVVASSPFRVAHREHIRHVADLVEPLDLALRNTRVLVRRTAVAAYHRREVPASYRVLCRELADAADQIASELSANQMAVAARPALMRVGRASAEVERVHDLTIEVVLAQIRSITADLLTLTGMDPLAASDALPPNLH
ncbi:FUSC family protein [Janibacter sp. G1551]|uniref:FUSC family protein n=1 Tax=Janibacter sp. G1551 TaxID=3420440 RepID=UPI003D078471